jgi:type I restriction enzyme, S subunit
MAHTTYSQYRKTNCSWLQEIPAHWAIKRLKIVATCNDEVLPETTYPDYEFDYVDIGSVSLIKGVEKRERMTFEKAPSRARRVVRRGDSIVSTVRTYLKAVATIDTADDDLVVSTGFAVLRPGSQIHQKYLGYFVQTHGFVDTVVAHSTGVSYPAILASDVMTIPVTVPTIEEQEAIGHFLDRETKKVDALVEKKRRLVELLEEKRLAVIAHTLTKGLDSKASMKDSGFDWIGQVPAHWEVKRLKFAAAKSKPSIQIGPFGGMITNLPEVETAFKLYGQENTISGDFSIGHRWIEPERFAMLKGYELIPGDIVVTRKGSLGGCRIVPVGILPGIMDSDTIRIRPDQQKVSSGLLGIVLREADYASAQIAKNRRGAILAGLNSQTVSDLVVVLPPMPEQLAILDCIVKEELKINGVIGAICKAITRLVEYRSALITNAVTGKIDVRRLPENEIAA